jgi:hypothetical protein
LMRHNGMSSCCGAIMTAAYGSDPST